MERQFRINWQAIIEEAKQRRKSQKLTQSRLAMLAKVSTPTISRFENGEKDIQLSTALNILTVLGMNDQRNIIFFECDANYHSTRKAIVFRGKDGEKTITCMISNEALADHFGDNKTPLAIFSANREHIEHEARKKYLRGDFEKDGSILITTEDIG